MGTFLRQPMARMWKRSTCTCLRGPVVATAGDRSVPGKPHNLLVTTATVLAVLLVFCSGVAADVVAECECEQNSSNVFNPDGTLKDTVKKGYIFGDVTLTGPDQAYVGQWMTFTAGGGGDKDNKLGTAGVQSPKACEGGHTNGDSCGPCPTGTRGINCMSNAHMPYLWSVGDPLADVVVIPPTAESGWKVEKTIFVRMNNPSASVTITATRYECFTYGDGTSEKSASKNVSVVDPNPTPENLTFSYVETFGSAAATTAVAGMNEKLLSDEDGPTITDLAACGGATTGQYDVTVNKSFAVGNNAPCTNPPADGIAKLPGTPPDDWWWWQAGTVIFVNDILADDPCTPDTELVSLGTGVYDGRKILVKSSAGVLLLHEVGHLKTLSHVYRNATTPAGFQPGNNLMNWGVTSGWISSVPVPTEAGSCGTFSAGGNQTQTGVW